MDNNTITPDERKRGTFDPYLPSAADYQIYATYSTPRLRLLKWFGDPVAKRELERRGK